MRLYEMANVIRSKNAGPFVLTIDLVFETAEQFDRVMAAPEFHPQRIAALYGVAAADVRIVPFARVRTIKVSMPRPDGGPGDRDVYGCQQHFPLANLEIG